MVDVIVVEVKVVVMVCVEVETKDEVLINVEIFFEFI